jgi:hypothetical protein
MTTKNSHPYLVVDIRTNEIVGRMATARAARACRERLDLIYGAVRYVVVMRGEEYDVRLAHLSTTRDRYDVRLAPE